MNRLLETYIKRCIALEEQYTNSSNIIRAIINKFPSEYALPPALAPGPIAHDKRNAFWKRYDIDAAFNSKMNSSYANNKQNWFDFWQNSDELREYLEPELKSAEVILVEQDEVSALKISDVRSALEIAEDVEEFKEMIRTSIEK